VSWPKRIGQRNYAIYALQNPAGDKQQTNTAQCGNKSTFVTQVGIQPRMAITHPQRLPDSMLGGFANAMSANFAVQ
jgi:hypothetical protein